MHTVGPRKVAAIHWQMTLTVLGVLLVDMMLSLDHRFRRVIHPYLAKRVDRASSSPTLQSKLTFLDGAIVNDCASTWSMELALSELKVNRLHWWVLCGRSGSP